MTFNPNIPLGTDNLSTSQGQILANFTQLNTQFGVDHTAFNTGSGNGDGTHIKVTFDGPPSPIPTPSGNISNIYPNLVSAAQELHFKNALGTTQITSGGLPIWKGGTPGASGVVSATTGGTNSNGSMTLPNGVILKWGTQTAVNDGATVNFPVAFPSNCFSIQLTGVRDDVVDRAFWLKPGFTTSSFVVRVNSSSSNMAINYIAIGN